MLASGELITRPLAGFFNALGAQEAPAPETAIMGSQPCASMLPFSGSIAGREPPEHRSLMRTRTPDIIALLGLLAAALPRAAAADEVELCVTCAGPPAVYRCLIELPAAAKSPDARAQMLCVTELATAGGHQTCSVARVSAAPCQGPVRSVKGPVTPPPSLRETPAPPAPSTLPAASASVAAREPQADKQTAADAPAPDAAKPDAPAESAAKRTWTCVASFFKDC
jgi:hypothetical protein